MILVDHCSPFVTQWWMDGKPIRRAREHDDDDDDMYVRRRRIEIDLLLIGEKCVQF